MNEPKLTDERAKLLDIGQQFSNVAFNWSQNVGRVLTEADCAMLKKLQREWDDAARQARAAIPTPPSAAQEVREVVVRRLSLHELDSLWGRRRSAGRWALAIQAATLEAASKACGVSLKLGEAE